MAKNVKKQIHIGPLNLSPAAAGTIVCAVIALAVGAGLFASGMIKLPEKSSDNNQIVYSLHPYTISEISGGNYYVKDGNSFYKPAPGILYSDLQDDDIIAKEAYPEHRIAMFGMDDIEIPTMYSDSLLIYKAEEGGSVPGECVLERFKDEGYSIGIRGLTFQGNKCHTEVSGVTFYPGSSISSINIQHGNDLIIDKIDGTSITEKAVTSIGTVTGLSSGKAYTVDAYSGTTYIGGDFVADTHMFSSMERYVIDEYSMDPSNYAILSFPRDLWSGYYYVNGIGMIRYINHPKSMGDMVDDYNVPYYITDDSGNITTNPAGAISQEDELDEENAVWSYRFSVDEEKPYLSVRVNYSGLSHNTSGELISPEGRRTSLKEETSQVLSGVINNPSAGAWTLNLTGMKNKIFDVVTSFTEPSEELPVSTVIKDSTAPVTATLTLGKVLNDAYVTFRWENSEYAGSFKLEGPNKIVVGNTIDPSSVVKEIYGEVKIHAGTLPAGEYKFTAEGKTLGHIYITYEDAAPSSSSGEIVAEELYNVETAEVGDGNIEDSEMGEIEQTETTQSEAEN